MATTFVWCVFCEFLHSELEAAKAPTTATVDDGVCYIEINGWRIPYRPGARTGAYGTHAYTRVG